jgi:hypothetical protein
VFRFQSKTSTSPRSPATKTETSAPLKTERARFLKGAGTTAPNPAANAAVCHLTEPYVLCATNARR